MRLEARAGARNGSLRWKHEITNANMNRSAPLVTIRNISASPEFQTGDNIGENRYAFSKKFFELELLKKENERLRLLEKNRRRVKINSRLD